jgi:UDP-sugar transporter A1/2/3
MTSRQVFALFVLLAGVALVQLSTMEKQPAQTNGNTQRLDNALLGSLAVLGACFTSGFAAIYFEWILKYSAPQEQRPYSIWVRNFQLATFAGLSAAFGVWSKDGAAVSAKGLYQGFTPLVWLVVALEAFGGIIVALVIKYADNILKNFATAVSIVTSVVVSTLFLGFTVKPMFVIGSICVMAAVAIYTTSPKPPVKVGTPHNANPKTETSPHSAMELGAVNPSKPRAQVSPNE